MGGGIAYKRRRVRREGRLGAGAVAARGRSWSRSRCSAGRSTSSSDVANRADNVVISSARIENLDPMGVHTGDSITVAPAMNPDPPTKEYQRMRDDRLPRHSRDRRRDRRLERAVRGQPRRRAHGHRRDEPARVAQLGAGVEGEPDFPSPRSRPSSPSATRSTRSRTTSRRRRRRRSSRPSITSWSRCRASPSRSSPAPTRP